MERELWLFDKISLERYSIGEYDSNFNVNLVLDGTKDTTKIIVRNYINEDIKPNTICYLPDLDLWFIVRKDICRRYTHEISALYEHEIELVGAFDILVNRDMTNCGFNKDRYTLRTFCERLASVVDFELPIAFNFDYFNENTKIGYIKTFENYAPSSAFIELFNGMNATPKMSFVYDQNYKLTSAIIKPIPKSGIDERVDISVFESAEETLTSEKSNYGTRVVSNIQNCVSSDLIRYPASGSAMLSCDERSLSWTNAYLKLPQKADYVDRIVLFPNNVRVDFIIRDDDAVDETYTGRQYSSYSDNSNMSYFIRDAIDYLQNQPDSARLTKAIRELQSLISVFEKKDIDQLGITIRNKEVVEFLDKGLVNKQELTFGDKLYYNVEVQDQEKCIYWEQGSNKISNFRFWNQVLLNQQSYRADIFDESERNPYKSLYVEIYFTPFYSNTGFLVRPTTYAVYYRPQVSVKFKADNDLNGKDTNLFNQTGKLVDTKAVSKLIDSHAKLVSSNEITRKGIFQNFTQVPKIGTIVNNNGVDYIITNLSLDFAENDLNNENYVVVEATLTKQIACKSTLVSANNNIRDYDLPQNYNIHREQLYRDILELDYTLSNKENTYIKLDFNFGVKTYGTNENYVALIKTRFNDSDHYYRLETTKVSFNKSVSIIVDFGDNNIIGYSKAQTNQFVFDIFRLFNQTSLANVPISYVDEKGELDSISMYVINTKDYQATCEHYLVGGGYSGDKISYFLYTPLFDESLYLYPMALHSFETQKPYAYINEENYKKDGLEVPIFQIVQQFIETNGIVIGDDICRYVECGTNEYLVYSFVVSNTNITNENIPQTTISSANNKLVVSNGVEINFDDNTRKLEISLLNRYEIDTPTLNRTNGTPYLVPTLGKNIGIVLQKVRATPYQLLTNQYEIIDTKLLFALNNCKANTNNGVLTLYINNYKAN